MNIVSPHRKISKSVTDYSQIESQVKELRELSNGKFQGKHEGCFALHHSQVSDEPFNFFVLSKSGEKYFKNYLIINPKIIEKDKEIRYFAREGCMSYPFREKQKLRRYGTIKAKYQDKNLSFQEVSLDGIAAEIFQHEFDHSIGKYIYDYDK